jgi:predicted FMN-binding regulatory protein PaiB
MHTCQRTNDLKKQAWSLGCVPAVCKHVLSASEASTPVFLPSTLARQERHLPSLENYRQAVIFFLSGLHFCSPDIWFPTMVALWNHLGDFKKY